MDDGTARGALFQAERSSTESDIREILAPPAVAGSAPVRAHAEDARAAEACAPSVAAPRPHGLATRLRRALLEVRMLGADAGPVVRRSVDIAAAGGALVALSPILLASAIAVKANSRGPLLYRQMRVGQNGRAFNMLKFRSMRVDADDLKAELEKQHGQGAVSGGVRFKLRKDPRTTAVGAFIRKFSIDELPQLWNVVRGDMTLVGPRPPVHREVAQYDPRALRRLEVRQGLTCLWQVGGRSELTFDEQVALDIEYIDRTTPTDELKIVAKTVPAVLSGRGAY